MSHSDSSSTPAFAATKTSSVHRVPRAVPTTYSGARWARPRSRRPRRLGAPPGDTLSAHVSTPGTTLAPTGQRELGVEAGTGPNLGVQTMKPISLLNLLALLAITGCSASPPPEACAAGEICTASTKPDSAKAKAHLSEHVKYPAKREQILAACAGTPEFSSGEKQSLSENLPHGDYARAD